MVKRALKAILARTPYRIARREKFNRFQAVSSTIETARRRGFDPQVVIDGGSNVGDFAVEMLAMFPQARVHAIEPQPGCGPALAAKASAANGRLTIHMAALGGPEDEGTSLMLAGDENSISTGAHVLLDGHRSENGEVAVPCHTLDTLLDGQVAPTDRIFLKLDLQGYELHALRGAARVLASTDLILTEVSFFRQAYEPPIETLVAFLSENGFELYDIASVSARSRDNRAKQGDFVFVRRGSPLALDTSWA